MRKKLLLFVCLLFSFLIVGSALQVPLVHAPYIGENCALYLPMNEGSGIITYDQSGNGNNGSLLPLIIGPTWVDGKYGKALSFDGTNDYVGVSSLDGYQNGKGATTLLCWVKFTSSSNDKQIFGWWWNWNTAFRTSNDGVRFYVSADTEKNVVSNLFLNDGILHLIVGTYDKNAGVNNVKLYVDGVLQGDVKTNTGNIVAAGDLFGIGALGNGGAPFNGVIDEVRIYNRTLTQAEITVLYNAGFTSTYSETLEFSESLVQKQEQKQVLTQVFSYSDGSTMTQEQKYSISETVTTTTVLTHGIEVPVTFLEVFNSETLHITDTIRIWQEHKYVFPSTLTFNDSPTFQNFVLEIYTYINEVLAVAGLAFILAIVALALVLVSQRQKD